MSGVLGWNKPGLTARRVYARWSNRLDKAAEARTLANAGTPVLFSLGPPEVYGSWTRVAAGSYDAALEVLIGSLPSCDFAFHHEPEDTAAAGTTTDFRDAFDHVAALLPPSIHPVVCLMEWTFDERSGRDWRDWLPNSAEKVAVDAYNWAFATPGAPWRSPFEVLANIPPFLTVDVWETNSYEDPSDPNRKGVWLRQWADAAEERSVEKLVFFDSGPTQPNTFRLLSSLNAVSGLQQLENSSYFGK